MTKEILWYKIKEYNEDSIIPNNAIFLQMNKKDFDIFNALKYNNIKKYWYYTVSTSVRRSGEYKISDKKYILLKQQYEKTKQ